MKGGWDFSNSVAFPRAPGSGGSMAAKVFCGEGVHSMRSIKKFKVDKRYQLSGYHLPAVDITYCQNGYYLLLSGAVKVKISLPGSVSE